MIWLALVAGAVVMAFPIYWMFATAVRPRDEIFAALVALLPTHMTFDNFHAIRQHYPLLGWTANSLFIAVVGVVITVFANLLCGYTFAKFRFAGRNILFFAILGTLMIPIQVILVPEFLITAWLGLLNTPWGVILPRAAEAFGIFMVRQFMVAIPDELLEAARLDGASELRIFLRIVVPLSRPIIAVLVIFTFMWRWNDFSWPLVVLTDHDAYTLPLGLNLLRGEVNPEWGQVMALALLSLAPMLIIFIAFQRFLIQGIASTGLK
ncbi:multiple sugar transport system permease protein/alpha-1,4-digalacturonate transport system permease protein [Rhizobiales bacterium GAS191]|jgi:alpha-1,4-digalacturonate transport system permease protein|nr:carbohydrate ABC transporter membrane protein 2, CUT1 family [Rhizobiales bacterium GAS113]SEB93120.1 multiple sugar transport system permease protein/alpha-1,4-digalacturonate transport system permease protein [Rhizobiales bacterium GAS191]SED25029.1 carbohydrate ABC transporter membrane protein 2, CUT1 family [Rhizobiales bacterium GAS188]